MGRVGGAGESSSSSDARQRGDGSADAGRDVPAAAAADAAAAAAAADAAADAAAADAGKAYAAAVAETAARGEDAAEERAEEVDSRDAAAASGDRAPGRARWVPPGAPRRSPRAGEEFSGDARKPLTPGDEKGECRDVGTTGMWIEGACNILFIYINKMSREDRSRGAAPLQNAPRQNSQIIIVDTIPKRTRIHITSLFFCM